MCCVFRRSKSRAIEILCGDAENLTCTRKLFLYNLLCMTHHIIFVNSVWENYKSGVDFAPGGHFGESQPKKLKSLFSPNEQRSRKFKHFTAASEIKSYREHPQKHKPQQMITQCACNKPASWLLNVRLIVRQKRDLLSQNLDCYMHCVVRERKEEKPLFKQTLKVTFRPYHELMMFCLACQLLFLTEYYFTIYAK